MMKLYGLMYLPMLMSACIVVGGYAMAWLMNGGGSDIDPGSPNARR